MMVKYIYIAGPYTHPDPVVNTRRAIEAGEILRSMGFVPFIPHLTHLWHLVKPHSIDYWYDFDIEWLKRCDGLIRLPGESVGADKEVEIARIMGIPIFEITKTGDHAELTLVNLKTQP